MNRATGDASLALASINIERSKHLDRVFAFLDGARPDVLCLQELMEDDIPSFETRFGYGHHIYARQSRHPNEDCRTHGTGVFSRLPFVSSEVLGYAGEGSGTDILDLTSMYSKLRTSHHAVMLVSVVANDALFSIANTHFPWTPDGSAADFQRTACDRMIAALAERELVLCGDFNAPRGGEIFTRLASQWRDNIPSSYVTSIDPVLHRAGPLQLMVDGLFSTPGYQVSNVALHTGVSDHCAVTATVLPRSPGYSR